MMARQSSDAYTKTVTVSVEEATGALLDVFEGRYCLVESCESYARNRAWSVQGSSFVSSLRLCSLIPSNNSSAVDPEGCA